MVCKRVKIGQMLRGQAWVSLHGDFTVGELKTLTLRIEELCRGLEKKSDNQVRHNSGLESITENH